MPNRKQAKPQFPMERGKGDRYFSKDIGQALSILEIFNHISDPVSLSEITRKTGLPKSSVFRILHTLEVSDYVQRDGSDRYWTCPHF